MLSKFFFLVLSHAHDDHIDDYFLKNYFCKDMKIIINKFPSPSLQKRIKKMGFENLYTGYESKVYRYPVNKYNRDIIVFLDMFGYKYENS